MKQYKYPYKKLNLGGTTRRDEHRVVMEQIVGRPLKRTEVVHHKDGDRRNNDPANLEILDAADHGSLHAKGQNLGEDNHAAKLTEAAVRFIRGHPEIRQKELAQAFGVHPRTIYSVQKRLKWRHV